MRRANFQRWARMLRRLAGHNWRQGSLLYTLILSKPELLPLHLTWIFTLALAIFAAAAWFDAQDASRKTQEQLTLLRNEQRPWLKVEINKSGRTFYCSDGKISLLTTALVATNVGKSPAFEVAEKTTSNEDCSRMIPASKKFTIFPGEKKDIGVELELTQSANIMHTYQGIKTPSSLNEANACLTYAFGEGEQKQGYSATLQFQYSVTGETKEWMVRDRPMQCHNAEVEASVISSTR